MRGKRFLAVLLGAALAMSSMKAPVAAAENAAGAEAAEVSNDVIDDTDETDAAGEGSQQAMPENEAEQGDEEKHEEAESGESASESMTLGEDSAATEIEEENAAIDDGEDNENSEQDATSKDLAEEDPAEETPDEESQDESDTAVDFNDANAEEAGTEDSSVLASSTAAEETAAEKGADPAKGIVDSGKCGDNVTWSLDDQGTMTISGTGAMTRSLWFISKAEVKKIIIEDGVTSIGDHGFSGFYELTSVSIPSSVTTIGKYAFDWCSKLKNIVIPSGVTGIGNGAFYWCSGLTSVTIPTSVTSIGEYAFFCCESLTKVTIPMGVSTIEKSMFCGCYKMTSVTIPSSVTTIGETAFCGCKSLKNISIPSSVTSIGDDAFNGCHSLSGIVIPQSVVSIGENAFRECENLVDVSIGDGVKTMGELAFFKCSSLQNLKLSSSLTRIEGHAFRECSSLKKVTIPASVESIGTFAFNDCYDLAVVTIGTHVKTIEMSAFSHSGIKSITIPASVQNIEYGAFEWCKSLNIIEFAGNAPEIGQSVFAGVTADAIYPKNNKTWTPAVMQNYGGTINWGSLKQISRATVSGIKNKTYTGREIKQTPKVVFGGKTLTAGTDYTISYKNNVKIGTATIIIKGKGDYTGSISKTFKITRISIATAKITGVRDKVYTGKAITQSPTVTLNGKTLTTSAYTVSYSNNIKVGTAAVIVKGKGNYTGTVKKTFRIGYSISKASITGIKNKTYSSSLHKSGATQSIIVKYGKTKLRKDTDYSIAYKNNKDVGMASVVVSGKGKYVGSATISFKINPQKVSDITLTNIGIGKFEIEARPVAQAGGYQYSWSRKSDFSDANNKYSAGTRLILQNAALGKKYYVRVRAYKKDGTNTLYGTWSSTKAITTKSEGSVKLDKSKHTIVTPKSKTVKLTATVEGKSKTVKWNSSNKAVAQVDQTGLVTAVANSGSARISATANGITAYCTITIQDYAYITKTLSFDSYPGWLEALKKAEGGLLPLQPYVTDYVSTQNQEDIFMLAGAEILEYKNIDFTYSDTAPPLSGNSVTVHINCPSKIRYKVVRHIHDFAGRNSYDCFMGEDGLILSRKCRCGYSSEWVWVYPDPSGFQTVSGAVAESYTVTCRSVYSY